MREMGGLIRRMPLTGWTFTIGALSLAGVPFLAGFYAKDEILQIANSSGRPWVYVLGSVGALLSALYIGRLIFLTFFGSPRSEAAEHAHESPPVMTLPLVLLAVGAAGGGRAELESGGPARHVPRAGRRDPDGGDRRTGGGPGGRHRGRHRGARPAAGVVRVRLGQDRLGGAARADGADPAPLRERLVPGQLLRGDPRDARQGARRVQRVRVRRPVPRRHRERHGRPRAPGSRTPGGRSRRASCAATPSRSSSASSACSSTWGSGSDAVAHDRHVPAPRGRAGAAGRPRDARRRRPVDRAVRRRRHLRRVARHLRTVRGGRRRLPDGGAGRVDPLARHQLRAGRGRREPVDGAAHHVPVPARDPRVVEGGPERPPVHDLDAGARVRRARHVPRARPAAVLRVLRGDPRPDVPDHRRLGRRATRVRGREVLPVHDGGLGVPARRDPVPVREVRTAAGRRHLLPAGSGAAGAAGRHRTLALPGVPGRLRREGADLPPAHLAARRPHRGADGRLGDPGRRDAEGRRVRPDPVQPRAVPGGVPPLRRASSRCWR